MINNWVKVDRSQFNELQEAIREAVDKLTEIKIKNKMLEDENKFLRGLVEKISTPIGDKDTFRIPSQPYNPYPWERQYGPPYSFDTKCAVCGIAGMNGYCCTRQNCPTGVSCKTNSSS